MKNARDLVKTAAVNIQQAVKYVGPSIANIKIENLSKGDIFLDIVFDNFFTDYMIREKIKKNIQKVKTALTQCSQAVNIVAQIIAQTTNNFNAAQQNYFVARQRLVDERKKIVERALKMKQNQPQIQNMYNNMHFH